MKRMPASALIVLLTGTALAFRQEARAAPESSPDSVKIVSISPDPATALRVGEKASFKVEVEYILESASSGSITLVIQRANQVRYLGQ
jgi:hypothetical protein